MTNFVAIRENVSKEEFYEDIFPAQKPVILKGLVSDWPSVSAAKRGPQELVNYLLGFYHNTPVFAFTANAETQGRYFYNDDLNGFNYKQHESRLDVLLQTLLNTNTEHPELFSYLGSTYIKQCLPGFEKANRLSLLDESIAAKIWLGNRSRIAAHYDIPDNIACVVSGKRRFTLFPTEQIENLYVGPLDFTPAGQSLSLVDFHNPDLQRFPKFKTALEHAFVADLEPGDALYLPGLWWHHVESTGPLNVLVNYWWTDAKPYSTHPFDALEHALLSIRDLSPEKRKAWRSIFEYYIFSDEENKLSHIPEAALGILSKLSPGLARKLRSKLINGLNR